MVTDLWLCQGYTNRKQFVDLLLHFVHILCSDPVSNQLDTLFDLHKDAGCLRVILSVSPVCTKHVKCKLFVNVLLFVNFNCYLTATTIAYSITAKKHTII